MSPVEVQASVGLDLATASDLSQHMKGVHSKIDSLKDRERPIYRNLVGAVQIAASSPAFTDVTLELKPSQGRLWNIVKVAVFGADGHTTPLTAGLASSFGSGTQVTPAINTTIAQVPASGVLPAGEYKVTVDAGFGPTAEATTNFNMSLVSVNTVTGVVTTIAPNLTVRNVNSNYTFTFNVWQDGQSVLRVVNPVASSAGAVYIADITATMVGTGAVAEIYAGDQQAPAQEDQIGILTALPGVLIFSKGTIWCSAQTDLFARVYGGVATEQLKFVAAVLDYPDCAVESSGVPPYVG